MIRRTPLRRTGRIRAKTTWRPKRQRIRNRSVSRRKQEDLYRVARDAWFLKNPACMFPGCKRSLRKGDAIDLHHKAGRRGPLLYRAEYFCTLCREHHDYVEQHLGWARENGFRVDVSSEEVQRMKQEEILNERADV